MPGNSQGVGPEGRYNALFFGATSSGKSTLLNALCGRCVLPENPMTSSVLPTRLHYQENGMDFTAWRYGSTIGESFSHSDFLRQFCYSDTKQGGRGWDVFRLYRMLDISLPAFLLRDGLVLYDTPGIGAGEQDDTRARTFAQDIKADLVFFITRNSNLNGREVDFICGYLWPLLHDQYDRFYLVANESLKAPIVAAGLKASLRLLFDSKWMKGRETWFQRFQNRHVLVLNARTARLRNAGPYPYTAAAPAGSSVSYQADAKRLETAEQRFFLGPPQYEDDGLAKVRTLLYYIK